MKNKYAYYLLLPGFLFLTLFMVVPIVLTIGSTLCRMGA